MNTQHTPGPLLARFDDHGLWLIQTRERELATVYTESDARLFASAPELLEALRCLVICLEIQGNPLINGRDVKSARAAIAKALGTESEVAK